jgi:hypothetical protein
MGTNSQNRGADEKGELDAEQQGQMMEDPPPTVNSIIVNTIIIGPLSDPISAYTNTHHNL